MEHSMEFSMEHSMEHSMEFSMEHSMEFSMEFPMEFSMDNPFLFSHHQLEPSYPMEMQMLPNQATESSGIYPIFEELASGALPPPVPPISGDSHTSPASNPPPLLNHPNQAQSFQLPSDVQDIAALPIPPPTKTRKRKAPTLTAEAWNPYKDRIVELHIGRDLPLSKVKETMEKEFGFTAEYVFT